MSALSVEVLHAVVYHDVESLEALRVGEQRAVLGLESPVERLHLHVVPRAAQRIRDPGPVLQQQPACPGVTSEHGIPIVVDDQTLHCLAEARQAREQLLPGFQGELGDCSFRRVGGTKEISVDVRIIAATNQDLKRCVESGTFREDLFYRLSVFEITLPALRDRGDDVLRLSEHFIGRLNPAVDHRIEGLSPGAARLLSNYDWPGNIRELRNVVERAMILARGREIRPPDLPKNLTRSGEKRRDARLTSLAEVERRDVEKILEATGFNIQRTAKILGVSRSALYAKMKRFGLAAKRRPRSKD